ncbi:hypothetical protein F4801DRAFT_117097 [Xylaria longipes]|nr:hypothetical protein F4801DRAFT_117097 [Xylaria longipes]
MAEPDVIFDPDGDLLIILHNASSIFNCYEEPEPELSEPTSGPEATTSESEIDGEATAAECDRDAEFQFIIRLTDWRFKASLKHLSLACPRFKTMMDGPWLEATQIHSDGLRHWTLQEFDLKAMIIILSIIHGKNNGVTLDSDYIEIPHTVELDMLVEIARIVDYLECYEVMEFFASTWISGLAKDIPVSYNTELLLWICVAGVFRKEEIFNRCTRLVIIENHSGIPTLGLPILPEISDEIDRRRKRHLDEIFGFVHRMKDQLTTKNTCSWNCDATRLGVLEKYMHDNSLSPRPKSPYVRLSIAWVIKTLNCLPSPKKETVFKWPGAECIDNLFDCSWGCPLRLFNKGYPDWYYQQWLENRRSDNILRRCSSIGENKDGTGKKDEKGTLKLPCLHCGFSQLIAIVYMVESNIEGLHIERLKKDLRIRRAERKHLPSQGR